MQIFVGIFSFFLRIWSSDQDYLLELSIGLEFSNKATNLRLCLNLRIEFAISGYLYYFQQAISSEILLCALNHYLVGISDQEEV